MRNWTISFCLAIAVAARVNGAAPDLMPWGPVINPSLTSLTFASDHCAVVEGCVGVGARRLLLFTTETRNIGNADLILGSPTNSPLFEYSPCHRHYHFKDFASYRLIDTNTAAEVLGQKYAFCLLDSLRWSGTASRFYNCDNQGLQVGWADQYSPPLDCQWIDVTDVAPGGYALEIEINPAHVLVESTYTNNTTSAAISIPPCATIAPTNLSISATGGSTNISVAGSAYCHWTATNMVHWLTVLSGTTGIASGTVNCLIATNFSTTSRTGTLVIGGRIFTVNQNVSLDTDGDGLPDTWEQAYFGSATAADANADTDGDGFSSRQEFGADTNPNDSKDYLRITSFKRQSDGSVVMTFPTRPGKQYRVDWRSDITAVTWMTLPDVVTGDSGLKQVVDLGAAGQTQRFYRLRLPLP